MDNDCDPATEDEPDGDGDGVSLCDDCDDGAPAVFPGQVEVTCDGVDNDCDPATEDEPDGDGDGWSLCEDCDDDAPAVSPGQAEQPCDGVDNDCDPATPDGPDVDGDGYTACEDCNDGNPAVNPGLPESPCDGLDNDCDPSTLDDPDDDGDTFTACAGDCDDGDLLVHPGYPDLPCDGIDNDCDPTTPDEPDEDGDGYTVCQDCDDEDPTRYPLAPETCNGVDDDCDGGVPADEADADGDGWMACEGDCDDAVYYVNPDVAERCDGLDSDCDGVIPADETDDADGDGYVACEDCDDLDPAINPAAAEVCANGSDDDCDGGADELDVDCGCDPVLPFIGNINITTEAAAQAFCGQYNTVYGSVTVDGNTLADVDDLACLCEVSSDLTFDQAPNLERIELPLLHSVGGDLIVEEYNDYLESIQLPSLAFVGGDLLILFYGPFALTDLDLDALENVNGDLRMGGTDLLALVFPSLVEAGGIWLFHNELADPVSFPVLTAVNGDVSIYPMEYINLIEAPALVNVSGSLGLGFGLESDLRFPSLQTVGDFLQFSQNFASLEFRSLTETGGLTLTEVRILDENFELPSLQIVHGDVYIWDASSQTDPPLEYFLPAVEIIEGNLTVEGWGPGSTDELALVDLPALVQVMGDVRAINGVSLTRLPWTSLQEIGGDLQISENTVLDDITGLYAIHSIGGYLAITINPSLPTAQAEALRDTIGVGNIGGSVYIWDNAP